MKAIRLVLLAATALVLVHAPARAQSSRPWHIGFGGGASVPAGDLQDALKSGYNGQGFVSFGSARMPIGGRFAVNYQSFDLKNTTGVGATGPTTGTVLAGLANVTYGFNVGPLKPYLLAGVGAFDLGSSGGSGGSSSKTHFGINAGAGLELKLGGIKGFVEGRFENVFTDEGLAAGASSAKDFAAQIIPVTFGVIF